MSHDAIRLRVDGGSGFVELMGSLALVVVLLLMLFLLLVLLLLLLSLLSPLLLLLAIPSSTSTTIAADADAVANAVVALHSLLRALDAALSPEVSPSPVVVTPPLVLPGSLRISIFFLA